jgi:hypothetical protein
MADWITEFILKPAPHLAAGCVLFGVVWGFFKGVESVLNDNTKLEIAVWLLGVKVGQQVEPWPDTFAKVFDRVFGEEHASWKCFVRSAIVSTAMVLCILTYFNYREYWFPVLPVFILLFSIFPDYLTLLKTRYALTTIIRLNAFPARCIIIVADTYLTLLLSEMVLAWGGGLLGFSYSWHELHHADFIDSILAGIQIAYHNLWHSSTPTTLVDDFLSLRKLKGSTKAGIALVLYPAFFTSIWLWLYAGSGFVLKAARRFDIGFQWFNRRFDIEKHPLSSIGLVAGMLVALIYWAAVIVSRVV